MEDGGKFCQWPITDRSHRICQTAMDGFRRESDFSILSMAACSVDREAAYEILMQLSSPKASPGTSATCNDACRTKLGKHFHNTHAHNQSTSRPYLCFVKQKSAESIRAINHTKVLNLRTVVRAEVWKNIKSTLQTQ